MFEMVLFLAVVASSFFLTWALRRYALARSLMDIPNERSSHKIPTPRGGGVAIVVSFLLTLVYLFFNSSISYSDFYAFIGAGALIAVIGFIDDHGHVSARWRLLGHFTAAAWLLAWFGKIPIFSIVGIQVDLGWSAYVLFALYLVWLLNLYNFMDGIDGIASIEGVTTCLAGVFLAVLCDLPMSVWIFPLILSAAMMGFLIWNFPPAKIFMGDAGSGFLGLTIAGISIQMSIHANQLFWSWVILLGVFVVDATTTLLRRVLRGEKFYEAHRSHAYQYVSRKLGAHRPVSLSVAAINLLWLLPLAWFVAKGLLDGVLGCLVAYAPLVFLAFQFKAGTREQ
ncbi:MAG: glycosyl transferase [Proteobacteria bacterium]|nr:glycosyl transferase [Pseudomonadota bacterium]